MKISREFSGQVTSVRFNMNDVQQVLQKHHLNLQFTQLQLHNLPFAKYVQKGDIICNLEVRKINMDFPGVIWDSIGHIQAYAKHSGYFFPMKSSSSITENELLKGIEVGKLVDNKEALADLYKFTYQFDIDPFTDCKTIVWNKVCNMADDVFPFSNAIYKLVVMNGLPYLQILWQQSSDKFVKGDTFQMCFSDDIVSHTLIADSYKTEYTLKSGNITYCANNQEALKERYELSHKQQKFNTSIKSYCYDMPLSEELLERFKNKELVRTRFLSIKNPSKFIIFENQFISDSYLSIMLFNKYAKTFEEAFFEAGYEWKDTSDIPSIDSEPCYVYLMIDKANGYHKIGISKKPDYREKTLQSEKPTIEKICAKRYPSRIIAEAIERALHNAFAAKRIRGEWFALSIVEVEDIISTLR